MGPRSRTHKGSRSVGALTLDFQLQTVRGTLPLFMSHTVHGLVIVA